MMATVHLIDNDEALRTKLGRLLADEGYQVRSYAAAGDYLIPDPDDMPGCLLMEVQLPGASGLDLQAALHRHPAYQRPIIFLSDKADVRVSVQAMRAGACEFLTKPIDLDYLLTAVEDAVCRDVALRASRARAEHARQRISLLTPRERQVLDGIVDGKLHKQMAAELGVSERTVKFDRARIMQRLGVRTLPDLLRMLKDAGEPSMQMRVSTQSVPQVAPQSEASHMASQTPVHASVHANVSAVSVGSSAA